MGTTESTVSEAVASLSPEQVVELAGAVQQRDSVERTKAAAAKHAARRDEDAAATAELEAASRVRVSRDEYIAVVGELANERIDQIKALSAAASSKDFGEVKRLVGVMGEFDKFVQHATLLLEPERFRKTGPHGGAAGHRVAPDVALRFRDRVRTRLAELPEQDPARGYWVTLGSALRVESEG